jgi:hypothetical protein
MSIASTGVSLGKSIICGWTCDLDATSADDI